MDCASLPRVWARAPPGEGPNTATGKALHSCVHDREGTAGAKLVEGIRDHPLHRGALVTTHKVSVFNAAAELFDELNELARTFGEISSISKRGTRLHGATKDPITDVHGPQRRTLGPAARSARAGQPAT